MIVYYPPDVKFKPLAPGDVVYFTKAWTIKDLAGKFFKIYENYYVRFDKTLILAPDVKYTFMFTKDEGLLPRQRKTLYEIMVMFSGEALVYPAHPYHKFILRLEQPEFYPNPEDVDKRYIGFYETLESPFRKPRLVIYTVEGMEPPALVFYNDNNDYEKIVMKMIINATHMEEIAPEEAPATYLTIITPEEYPSTR